MKKKLTIVSHYLSDALNRFRSYIRSPWFKADESYLSLPSFRIPFFLISLLAILAWFQIWITQGVEFNPSADLKNTYELFKIPLWILALLIPVLGLMNANHKSEQAKASMELSKSQNKFANYYKHVEEFIKHTKLIESKYSAFCLEIDSRSIHAILFPLAKEGDYKIQTTWISRVEKDASNVIKNIWLKRRRNSNSTPIEDTFFGLDLPPTMLIVNHAKFIRVDGDSAGNHLIRFSDQFAFSLKPEFIRDLNLCYIFIRVITDIADFEPHQPTRFRDIADLMKEQITFLLYNSPLSRLERGEITDVEYQIFGYTLPD